MKGFELGYTFRKAQMKDGKFVEIPSCVAKETLTYHEFSIRERQPSAFAPEATKIVDVGTKCPGCGNELPVLGHGDYCRCHTCDLQMQLFGNALEIWRHPTSENS